jgi:hypothetical protein
VDDALDSGRMDPGLPFIKRESVKLLGGDGAGADPDLLAKQFQQPGWFDQLAAFYRDNYPEIAASKRDAIQSAIGELKKISTQILYPAMRTDWLTYPDNLSHRLPQGIQTLAGQDAPGCFRCHGTLGKARWAATAALPATASARDRRCRSARATPPHRSSARSATSTSKRNSSPRPAQTAPRPHCQWTRSTNPERTTTGTSSRWPARRPQVIAP